MLNSLPLKIPFRPQPGAVPFRTRFRAWWEGEDPPVAQPESDVLDEADRLPPVDLHDKATAVADVKEGEAAEGERPFWNAQRVNVAQRIWQYGYLSPSGDHYNRDLISPTALKPALSVLNLGAGLGGMARLMAREFGLWVTAMEQSQYLVQIGNEQATMAGLAKKASIKKFDPHTVKLRKRSFDRIFAQELFHALEDKEGLLTKVCSALKPKGQLLFTDFMLAESAAIEPKIGDWAQHEPQGSSPWSVDKMKAFLEEAGLSVRIAEDQTAEYREQILDAWGSFLDSLKGARIPAELVDSLLAEAERWSCCVEAMDRSVLRHYRILALNL